MTNRTRSHGRRRVLVRRSVSAVALVAGAGFLVGGSGTTATLPRVQSQAAAAHVVPLLVLPGGRIDPGLDVMRLQRALDRRPPATRGLPSAAPAARVDVQAAALPSVDGIPAVVLAAYRAAVAGLARTDSSCHLSWPLLAAIGRVESNHAASGGSGAADWDGTARPPILGPVLDGSSGTARITDSDGGRYDGDRRFDRAVGPMQFIPSSWRGYGRDGNGDGRADPQQIADAALAAATYLCAGDGDLRDPRRLAEAVYSYNHSVEYVRVVLTLAAAYAAVGPAQVVLLPYRTAAPPTPTSTPAPSPSPSGSPTPTPSPSGSPTPTPSPSPSGSPTPTPAPSPPTVFAIRIGDADRALPVVKVPVIDGIPKLPDRGQVGWWPKSARPGQSGTMIVVAEAGTADRPGPFDRARLTDGTVVTVRTNAGRLRFRVVGHRTATALPEPAPTTGPRQLLLVSYDQGNPRPVQLSIVRAVPV